ncbi:hypothetical protein MHY01S_02970 [Meiothermus hypogaeus NBRC 106114]|uniref:G8 domain-containing protein n=3 Tax=Meiothermus hypogaeus TaxID=884155 RepID=A0A511QXM9_9DEIN|nr:G8 domain protein [Meiothermus hypogaeus]GEM82131.1 hypothetical protein MHY01S_02970 [Meiothermus hypogaeus NBRC 106114]
MLFRHLYVVILAVLLAGCGNTKSNPNPPGDIPITFTGNWSDPKTWQEMGRAKPVEGDAVTIPAGRRVILDESTPDLAGLTILGELEFARRDLSLTADWIMLHGALKIGSETEPFAQKATLTLNAANPNENLMNMGTRGILLMGGQLLLYGQRPNPTWTKIAEHAAQGATTLRLEDSVNWAAGSQVVLAPTDFFPHNNLNNPDPRAVATELLEVGSQTGNSLTLKTGLQKPRWGKLQYVGASGMTLTPTSAITNLVLDERAAIGNLSRNIVIQAADDTLWREQGFGAHIMAMAGSVLKLDGVELRRVGQLFRQGRYPIHWHMLSYDESTGAELGDATGQFVRNSSIWNSVNRCVTIHGTNGVTVSNNICYGILGHAVFLEDAVERRNVLENNLVLQVRQPPRGNAAPAICTRMVNGQRDCRILGHDGEPTGFWLTNPDNIVRGNIVGDSEGKGFWLAYPKSSLGLSQRVNLRPDRMAFGVFADNVAHSSLEGIHIDNVPTRADPGQVEVNKYIPMREDYNRAVEVDYDFNKWLRFRLERITVYKNGTSWGSGAFWNRVSWPDYVNWVSADNTGAFFAGAGDNGRITDSLIIGQSLNNATPLPNRNDPQVALASYHSTFDIDNNVIVNFPFVPRVPGSGAFKTDDYYTRGIDKGLVRNPDNRLINSDPGYRVPPPSLAPEQYPRANENWTLAGALWDPHGYWGPKGNFWVFDVPFLTHGDVSGQICTDVRPTALGLGVTPGTKNGASCNGQYYGVGDYLTDFDTRRYNFKHPIEVSRRDPANVQTEVGRWTVADGNISGKLGNMRSFAARTGGYYLLRFPSRAGTGYDLPKWVELEITNAFRDSDWFVLAVSLEGSVPLDKSVYMVPAYQSSPRRDFTPAGSLAEVVASGGDKYWRDPAQNLLWLKIVGGLKHRDFDQAVQNNPNSDFALYGSVRLFVNR